MHDAVEWLKRHADVINAWTWACAIGLLLVQDRQLRNADPVVGRLVYAAAIVAVALTTRWRVAAALLAVAMELVACAAEAAPGFHIGVVVVCAASFLRSDADHEGYALPRVGAIAAAVATVAAVAFVPWAADLDSGPLFRARPASTSPVFDFILLGVAVGFRVNWDFFAKAIRGAAERTEAARAEAVVEERARIARELHDVVAHQMSVVVAQAQGAEAVLTADPAQARRALATIAETSRDALVELRRLVTVSRPAHSAGAPSEPERPQPGLGYADLAALGTSAEAAGLAVEMHIELQQAEPVSAGLALAAYRTIQESLTNAAKHAPGSTAKVTVSQSAAELVVEIVNGPPQGKPLDIPGARVGVIGMIERAQLFGGTLHTGPTPDGGWSVRATFPTLVAPPRSE